MASRAAAHSEPMVRRESYAARRMAGQSLAMLFLAVFAVYFLLPLVWLVFSSTKTNSDLFSSPGLWFGTKIVLAQNLHDLFTKDSGHFVPWFLNTVFYAGA